MRFLKGHSRKVTATAWAKSDAILVSASADEGTVHCWDVETGALLCTHQTGETDFLVGSPQHSFVIVITGRGTMIFDAEDPNGQLQTFDRFHAAAFVPDGGSIIAFRGRESGEGPEVWGSWQMKTKEALSGFPWESLTENSSYLVGPQVRSSQRRSTTILTFTR